MKSKIITIIIASAIASTSLFAHSRAIKPEYIDMLLKPYFMLQASFASDDLDASKNNANSLKIALGKGPSSEDAPSLLDLGDAAKKITDASTIEEARTAFLTLSEDLSEMIEHVGTTKTQNIYKMSCPMAFDGKGGEWLQNNKDLTNPYFGATMLRCGTEDSQLAKANSEHAHSEHKH
jgi:Cu(I)/Ag(I) efflux system membrane fusion protein